MTMNVSLVVPIYNEASQIEALMGRLILLAPDVKDIILVDGGSQDGTYQIVKDAVQGTSIRLLNSEKGRAHQMNRGAEQSRGSWLFFLHADTELTINHIRHALDEATLHHWGRFDVRLSGKATGLRMVERMMNWRSRFSGIATGDQCIFVRKALFDELGGFASMPLMEDIELSKRLCKQHKPVCIDFKVTTSSRKWEADGLWPTIFLMWKLRFAYWRGVAPEKLVNQYYR